MHYEAMTRSELIQEITNLSQQLDQSKNEGNEKDGVICNDGTGNEIMDLDDLSLYPLNEEAFRNFIESAPVAIYVYKGNNFVYINPASEKALGYSLADIKGINFWEFVHPDFRDLAYQRGLARQKGENVPLSYEIRAISKSGEDKWFDLFHSKTTVDGKKVIVVGAYDITEKKLMKEKLELSEAQYRAVVEDQPEMILRLSLDKKINFINEAASRYFGFQHEDFIVFSLPDRFEQFRDQLDQHIRLLGPENPAVVFEQADFSDNGCLIWNEWIIRAIIREKTKSIEYQIVGRDITERKLVQDELQKTKDQLEMQVIQRTAELSKSNQELTVLNDNLNNIIMNMSDGVVLVNENYEFDILNPCFKKTGSNLVAELERDLKNNLSNGIAHYINKMLKEKIAFQDEEIFLTTAKEDMHFVASGTPIINKKGDVKSGLIIIRPIKQIHRLVNRFNGAQAKFRFEDIIAKSDRMLGVIKTAKMAAGNQSNVLIEGESGTGKDVFAQAIHNQSQRRDGPFVAVNCGAIPRELIGSELFGYAEGAFTGAKKGGNPGKFELASGGTIFLDEIGDMPFEQQVALLRVIEEKAITRIGDNRVIPVDVRIICASNKNIIEEMEQRNFRKDLYYRINVINLKIPALRERKEDIPLLFEYFLSHNRTGFSYKEELLSVLSNYYWPGNVRELQNVVERMINMATGTVIGIELLPPELQAFLINGLPSNSLPFIAEHNGEFENKVKSLLYDMERNEIIRLLDQFRGNVSKVARELGVSRNTIYRKMKLYKINK